MLYNSTLSEIANNINTGVEYEIALFYKLLKNNEEEQSQVMEVFQRRHDSSKIEAIIAQTDISIIESALSKMGLSLCDATFETQNDIVGPSDIIMIVTDCNNDYKKIGLSVKYSNTCTLNVTGRNFITDSQIGRLKAELPHYTRMFIEEMNNEYGCVDNWFRKRKPSKITDAYIDLIRDAVIENWPNIRNKTALLSECFHSDSPIVFWVVTYNKNGFDLQTTPQTIEMSRANDVIVKKFQTSYVAFYLDGRMIAHMQVKFNNGFIEKCKKKKADIIEQGVRMSYGMPFSSWNFSVEK